MIKLKDVPLPKKANDELKKFQKEIDDIVVPPNSNPDEIDKPATFKARGEMAKKMFSRKNTKRSPVFKEVKLRITEMCNSTRRCVYCEDSLADEVEHIYP